MTECSIRGGKSEEAKYFNRTHKMEVKKGDMPKKPVRCNRLLKYKVLFFPYKPDFNQFVVTDSTRT